MKKTILAILLAGFFALALSSLVYALAGGGDMLEEKIPQEIISGFQNIN